MSSAPTFENNEQFVAWAKLFHGLGTPKLLAADQVNGFFLMEDLGSVHLSDAYLRVGADQTALADILNLALDALKPLQELADPQIPPYTEARFIMEFDLCAEWFARGLMSIPLSADDQTALAAARSTLVDAMLEQPQVCVHRDYHCRNLLLSGDESTRTSLAHGLSWLVSFVWAALWRWMCFSCGSLSTWAFFWESMQGWKGSKLNMLCCPRCCERTRGD